MKQLWGRMVSGAAHRPAGRVPLGRRLQACPTVAKRTISVFRHQQLSGYTEVTEGSYEKIWQVRGLDRCGCRHLGVAGDNRDERNQDLLQDHHRAWPDRSEEHTSELQSLRHLVCRPLL